MEFYLGTHQPNWLTRTRVPLFVSFRRLHSYKHLPRSKSGWAMDSGGFSEILTQGRWTITSRQYAEGVRRIAHEVGNMRWATIQDWVCSPGALRSSGLSLRMHQRKTVQSLESLRTLAPEMAWLPVLQGWNVESYITHLKMYRDFGFALEKEPLVGVGSFAARQRSKELNLALSVLHHEGIRIHAFGLSSLGLMRVHRFICSADSMVWSYVARRRRLKHTKCQGTHSVCNNCLDFALAWRRELLSQVTGRKEKQN